MKTIKERTENPTEQQKYAQNLVKEKASEGMRIAADAAKRAKLVQNRLFQKDEPSIYRKVF
jgi:hypothetical protein